MSFYKHVYVFVIFYAHVSYSQSYGHRRLKLISILWLVVVDTVYLIKLGNC